MIRKDERKRHTKPCKYFQIGTCPLSPVQCDFAHIFSESLTMQLTDSEPHAYIHPSAKLCRFYETGCCRNGSNCRFRHDSDSVSNYLPLEAEPQWINSTEGEYAPTLIPYMPRSPAYPHVPHYGQAGYHPAAFWAPYEYYPQYSPNEYSDLHSRSNHHHHTQSDDSDLSRNNSVDSQSSGSSSLVSLATPISFGDSREDEIGLVEPSHAVQVVEGDSSTADMHNAPNHYESFVPQFGYEDDLGRGNHQSHNSSQLDVFNETKMINKEAKYKTVQCKFYNPPMRYCQRGNECTFIHSDPPCAFIPPASMYTGKGTRDSRKTKTRKSTTSTAATVVKSLEQEVVTSTSFASDPLPASSVVTSTLHPVLPPKPLTKIEAERQKGLFPVTWRVVSGGVLMGKPDSGGAPRIKMSSGHSTDFTMEQARDTFVPPPSCPPPMHILSLEVPGPNRPRKRTISSPSTPTGAIGLHLTQGSFAAESP